MFSRNIKAKKRSNIVTWRKIAIGSWSSTGDCQIRGLQKVEVSNTLKFLEEVNKKGSHITMTHFFGKACAMLIKEYPQINSFIRFGNIYQREEIALCFQVASESTEEDLSSYTLAKADEKSLFEIADELSHKSKKIKKGDDEQFKKTKNVLDYIPGFLIKSVMNFIGFFMYSLNLWTPALTMKKDSFGSMMITSIGPLGIRTAFSSLVHFTRVPIIVTVGAVYEDAYSKDGELKSGQFINLGWTGDHRLIDGLISSKLSRYIEKVFQNPELVLK